MSLRTDLFGAYAIETLLLVGFQTRIADSSAAKILVQAGVSVQVVVDIRDADAVLSARRRRQWRNVRVADLPFVLSVRVFGVTIGGQIGRLRFVLEIEREIFSRVV